ncbi:hypothetical protein ACLOJK_016353 [Asimina triloba]
MGACHRNGSDDARNGCVERFEPRLLRLRIGCLQPTPHFSRDKLHASCGVFVASSSLSLALSRLHGLDEWAFTCSVFRKNLRCQTPLGRQRCCNSWFATGWNEAQTKQLQVASMHGNTAFLWLLELLNAIRFLALKPDGMTKRLVRQAFSPLRMIRARR